MSTAKDPMTYASILRFHARKSLLWASLLGAVGLGLISMGSAKIDWLSGLVYLPLLLIMLVSLMALLTMTNPDHNLFRYLADAYAATAILGATLLVIRADMIDFVIRTSPIQYALLISFPFCFHLRRNGIIRNLLFAVLSFAGLAWYSHSLAASLYLHYIFGLFAGSIVYLIAEDRMHKDFLYKQSMETERTESSLRMRHLHTELRSRCLPHQIELIYKGHHYRETMPVYRSQFWVSCLSIVNTNQTQTQAKNCKNLGGNALEHRVMHQNLSQQLRDRFRFMYASSHSNLQVIGGSDKLHDGYYIRCDDSRYFVSYDYPFPMHTNPNKGTGIVTALLKQLRHAFELIQQNDSAQHSSAIISLSYDTGQGTFTGSLSNYEIEGRVLLLAERYQSARFQVPCIEDQLQQGNLAIICSSQAYIKLKKDLPRMIRDQFSSFQVRPHIRDDKEGTIVYVWFIRPTELENFQNQLNVEPHLKLVA